ncbi:MAG: IS3 family transposase [bacterium]|nr:IS3 family transposase [bacterium]
MEATTTLSQEVGVRAACSALGMPRATYYRRRDPTPADKPRPRPPLALDAEQRQAVVDVLHSPRFVDRSPHQIWAVLLDEEQEYLCSVRTMYRILEAEGELRERRNQLRRPVYAKPELVATAPNQVWTWDITKLKGPAKWTYFYLYVILDLYSRYVPGWMVARRESGTLARRLIAETVRKQGIRGDQLTVHADRGSSMRSKTVALLLADLGVRKSHSRPYTSNDNPFSEAQFKTMKYHPSFPERFGSLEDSRGFCAPFLGWYNTDHRHSSLAYLTPADVHYGRADQILQQRAGVLRAAFETNPQRFKGRMPSPGKLPEAVWINPPKETP